MKYFHSPASSDVPMAVTHLISSYNVGINVIG